MNHRVDAGERTGRLRKLGYAQWLVPGRHRVAYVGWIGFGNLGDEAMHEVFASVLSGAEVTPVPDLRALRALCRYAPPLVPPRAVLGGGTLIGYRRVRESLESLLSTRPQLRWGLLGSGVEIPHATTWNQAELDDELRAWAPLLRRAPSVTVRGPLSQARLAQVDVEAVVSGDSALLAADGAVPEVSRTPGLIGINLGVHSSMTELQRRELVALYVAVCRRLAQSGHQFVLLPVWGPDVAVCREVADQLGAAASVVDAHHSTPQFLAAVGACELVIAQKLHAAVLAAAIDVPAIAIEYQPKCRDFQASVGREEYCFGLQEPPDVVLEGVTATIEALAGQTAALRDRVSGLRQTLRTSAAQLREHVLSV